MEKPLRMDHVEAQVEVLDVVWRGQGEKATQRDTTRESEGHST